MRPGDFRAIISQKLKIPKIRPLPQNASRTWLEDTGTFYYPLSLFFHRDMPCQTLEKT